MKKLLFILLLTSFGATAQNRSISLKVASVDTSFVGTNYYNKTYINSNFSLYVPKTRTITINGTALDLSADRSWSVGTITSVAASVPAFLSVSGSPITTSGTLAITLSGTALPVANGGTGLTTLTSNTIYKGNGTTALAASGLSDNGTTISTTEAFSSGAITTSSTITLSSTNPLISFNNTTPTTGKNWTAYSTTAGGWNLDISGVSTPLGFSSTGAATFSSTINSGAITSTVNGQNTFSIVSSETSGRTWSLNTAGTTYGSGAGSFVVRNNGVDALTFNSSSAATFSSTINSGAITSSGLIFSGGGLNIGNSGLPLYWNVNSATQYNNTSYAGAINIETSNGRMAFYTAPSGTSGTTPTFTERLTIGNTGIISIANSTASSSTSTGALVVTGGMGVGGQATVNSLVVSSSLQVNSGAATFGYYVTLAGTTVALLPTPTVGSIMYVTDALSPTYGATVVGGGSVKTLVFYDGSAWKVH